MHSYRIYILLAILFMVVAPKHAFAQYISENITIKISNAVTKQGIPYATVAIKENGSGKNVLGTADSLGYYKIQLPVNKDSKISIRISALGFEPKVMNDINLKEGEIIHVLLGPAASKLQEVTLVGERVVRQGPKSTYKIKQDNFSKGVTGVEVMTRLPGVHMPGGMLRVYEKGNILVLIDGRGENKSQAEQMALVAAMTAEQIEKIEVNTVPGGRYPSGTEAVINVITNKVRNVSTASGGLTLPFYTAPNKAGFNNTGAYAGTNLNFLIGKVRITATERLSYTASPKISESYSLIYNRFAYSSRSEGMTKSVNMTNNLTADFDLNKRSSINIDLNVPATIKYTSTYDNRYSFTNTEGTHTDSTALMRAKMDYPQHKIQATASLKTIINAEKAAAFYANLTYSKSLGDQNYNYTGWHAPDAVTETAYRPLDDKSKFSNDVWNLSAIWINPVKYKSLTTELGGKGNLLNYRYDKYRSDEYHHFNYNEALLGLWATAGWKLGKYDFYISTELEQLAWNNAYTNPQLEVSKADRNKFYLFPRVYVGRDINKSSNISIDYNRTVRYPWMSFFNPSPSGGYYGVMRGNQYNWPTILDNAVLALRYKNTVVRLYYRTTANQMVIRLAENGDPYSQTNFNESRNNRIGAALGQGFSAGEWLSLNINASVYYDYYTYKQADAYRNTYWAADFNGSADITLGPKDRISAELYYGPRLYNRYGWTNRQTGTDIIWRHTMGKRGSLRLAVTDPLGLQKTKNVNIYPSQYYSNQSITSDRMITVSYSQSFKLSRMFNVKRYKNSVGGEIRN